MKRKILSVVLVLAFFTGVSVPVRAVDKVTEYTLGTTVSGTRALNANIWYSVEIESDGLYKVFSLSATDSELSGESGGKLTVYDKSGSIDFSPWSGVTSGGYEIIPYNLNHLEGGYVWEYALYLHKGKYMLRNHGGRGTNRYSFNMVKIPAPYGEDKEPNSSAADAIPIAFNGKAGGVMGGVYNDGTRDRTDFYKIDISGPMKCTFHLMSDNAQINFTLLNSKGEDLGGEHDTILSWDGNLIYPWDRNSKLNKLTNKFEINLEADIKEAGTYYVRLHNVDWYGATPYNPYLLTVGDGGDAPPKPEDPKPINPKPVDPKNEIPEVAIPGEPEGKLTALVTEVGIKFDITPNTGKFGYRIYRSTDPNDEGISISDFPLVKGQFVDVNIDPNTTYYYTIRRVISEAGLDRETIEIIPEVLGDPSQKIILNSGDIIVPPEPDDPTGDYTKNFLLMKIGDPNMLFNEKSVEIDPEPGRSTSPIIENGRTLLPIRAIIECMGGTVGWDGDKQQVSLLYGELSAMDFEVLMTIGNRELTAKGEKKTMDIAPQVVNGRTMLPLRFVTENVGAEIAWIGSTREIIIVFYTKMV